MKLHAGGYLAFFLPDRTSPVEFPLDHPVLLKDILEQLRVPISEIQMVSLNGSQVDWNALLVSDSDVVHIISAVDGG